MEISAIPSGVESLISVTATATTPPPQAIAATGVAASESSAQSSGKSADTGTGTDAGSGEAQQPVSVYEAKVNGQTEGVRVAEVGGRYFAGVQGPPPVTVSGASLTGAEDRLAYIVNLFA